MNNVHYSSKTDLWSTPQKLFDELNAEFHFTLDPCSTNENAKCAKFYTKNEDGLLQDWDNEIVFMNPPYGREIGKWVRMADRTAQRGGVVVALLPARTDTIWFQKNIYKKYEIRFLKGRLYFGDGTGRAPFPNMVVIFKQK